jgi:sugar/nucleoside kinase (ribokinase family)
MNPQRCTPDVVVVGNVGIDTAVYLPGADIDFGVGANFTENLDTVGQAGGYCARAYATLGWATAVIGHVGDDFCGRFVRETLIRDGIGTEALFTDPAGTARSVNFMYRDGRRKNFYDGKSHMTLNPDPEACRGVLLGARLAHVNLPNWARHLLPVARELGLIVACDLQDVVDPTDPYRRDFIEMADIILFSAVNQPDPTAWIAHFLRQGPARVVIAGLGARGCAVGTAEGIRIYASPPLDWPVLDTNGAGDSLAVGFLSSYILEGYSLEDSILRGQIAARHTCRIRGSTDGLITRHQLDSVFAMIRPLRH